MTQALMKEMMIDDEIMTNQQFDAIIKMVLNLIDSNEKEPDVARRLIADLLIDKQDRQIYKTKKQKEES